MKTLLIIANDLGQRLSIISQLRGLYLLESWTQIPRSINDLRNVECEGIIVFVQNKEKCIDFCRKLSSTSFTAWICLVDQVGLLENPEEVVQHHGLAGYWRDAITNEFPSFIKRCALGNVIIHKRESRLQRFLGILSTKTRKTE